MKFILGSSSHRRFELLKSIGINPDQVISPDIDESIHKNETPKDYVKRISFEKMNFLKENSSGSIILTADTIAFCGRRLIDKTDKSEIAIQNLNFLSEYKFNDNSSLNVNFRLDVKQNKTADFAYGLGTEFGLWTYNFEQKFYSGKDEKMILSAVYDDECTRFTVSFQNQYRDTAGADPIRTLALRFQFKPFAKVQLSRESVSNSSNSQF